MQQDLKDEILRKISHHSKNLLHVFWCGDWNFIEHPSDSSPETEPDIPDEWTATKLKNNLTDCTAKLFPNSQYRKPPTTFFPSSPSHAKRRLDRIYYTKHSPIKPVSSNTFQSSNSDHAVFSCTFQLLSIPKGPGRFIANMSPYEKKESLKDELNSICQTTLNRHFATSPHNLAKAWDKSKSKIVSWLKKKGRDIKLNRKQQLRELHETALQTEQKIQDAITSQQKTALSVEKLAIQNKINKLVTESLEGYKMRARARWAENAEQSTKYWYKKELQHIKKKHIPKMHKHTDPNRLLAPKTHPNDIANTIKNYLSDELYQERPIDAGTLTELADQMIQQGFQFTDAHKQKLGEPITEEELSKVIDKASADSSPGPDGLTFRFYKITKNEILPYLTQVLNEIFIKAKLPLSMSNSLINMIPKGNTSTDLPQNLRPITLTNCDYKLFTNILAQRLGPILHQIIGKHQSGFIPGRDIRENILSAQLLIDWLETKRLPSTILLLDWEKAFDRVSHEAIKIVMDKLDVPLPFFNSILAIYTNSQAQVFHSSFKSDKYTSKSGTKQGCPLSPLIFIIMAELFLTDLKTSLPGVRINNTTNVSCQAYADDTLAVINSVAELQIFRDCVSKYEAATAAKLNVKKSTAIPTHYSDPNLLQALRQLEFEVLDPGKPTRYLGAPICIDPQYHDLENTLIQKCQRTAALWHSLAPTTLGRALLIKSKILSQAWYWASFIPFSEEFINQLQKISIDFLWKYKKHKLRLANLELPKTKGGLNLFNLHAKIHSLQAKWAFLFHARKTNSYWADIAENLLTDRTKFPSNTLPLSCWSGEIDTTYTNYYSQLPSKMLNNIFFRWRQISLSCPPDSITPNDWLITINSQYEANPWLYKRISSSFIDQNGQISERPTSTIHHNLLWHPNNDTTIPLQGPPHPEPAALAATVTVSPAGIATLQHINIHQGTFVLNNTNKITNLNNLSNSQVNRTLYQAMRKCPRYNPSTKPKTLPISDKLIKQKIEYLKNLTLTPAMRNFEWSVINNILPTNAQTHKQKVQQISDKCPYCPLVSETATHRLSDCPFHLPAKQLIQKLIPELNNGTSLEHTLLYITPDNPYSLTAAICIRFASWKLRNQIIFNRSPVPANPTLNRESHRNITLHLCSESLFHLKSLKKNAVPNNSPLIDDCIDNLNRILNSL